MTRSRLADLVRGAFALLALLALIAGPPVALVATVGWPLPTSIPSLTAIEEAARSGVSDQFVVKALAVVVWVAWLQVAAAVACELVALARRRPTVHLPVLPGLQPFVAKIAAAALLLAATASSRAPHAAAQPATPPPATMPPAAATVPVLPAVPADPPTEIRSAAATVTVERHDSYWAIAERTLGDGFRWREIRDANIGRTMPDGHVIAHGSDVLRPGWILEIPATRTAVDPQAPAPLLVPNGTEITVEAGDGFWDIAAQQVEAELGRAPSDDEIRPYWAALVDANHDRLADPADPDLLFTGQHLALVGPPPAATAVPPLAPDGSPRAETPAAETAGPVMTAPAPTTPTTAYLSPSDDPAPAPAQEQPQSDAGSSDSIVNEIAAAGFSALLAVGAARTLARGRRRRAHLRVVADHPTRPEETDVHRQILLSADASAVENLEAGLAHLAGALRDGDLDTTPIVVQHGGGHLDVYVDPPAPPPSGWTTAGDTNAVWTAAAAGTGIDGASICPAPLLVTLGQPDDGGQLYLDLESVGLVALTGDLAIARDVARTMVADLALSPVAGTIDIVVIGDLGGNTAQLEHVRHVDDWSDVADDVEAWIDQTHGVLKANGWPNPFVARAIDPDHDALAPLAVVAAEVGPPDLLARIAGIGASVAGVVVVGSDVSGALRIDCSRDRIAVPSIGLEAIPHLVDVASLEEIVALLDDPADEEVEPSESTLFDEMQASDVCNAELPEPEVLVRVLGEIGIDGGQNLTAKQTGVLAFIALHGTVTAERVENAVWAAPSTSSRRKRLANTVSEIRAAIGRHHLPAAADGRYTTGPAVTTDAHLFDRLVRRGAGETPERACDTLRAALDVVSGPVFTYREVDRASFTWVDLENLVSTWELRIAAVAEHCAELYIQLGQPSQAVEVANRALTLIPTHTGITEALMCAHAANGDRLAVQRVFQAHASALEQLDLDDVADSTSELYERLSQRSG